MYARFCHIRMVVVMLIVSGVTDQQQQQNAKNIADANAHKNSEQTYQFSCNL